MSSEFQKMIYSIKEEYPVLSPSEERELLLEYRDNPSEELLQKISLHNIGFVMKMANQYYKSTHGYDIEDLFSEGMIGLMCGIEKYDIDAGTRLSTYVGYWIKQRIERFIQDKGDLIHVPLHITTDYYKILNERKKRALEDNNNDYLTVKEINDLLPGRTKAVIDSLYQMQISDVVSMNVLIGDEEKSEFGDLIEDKSVANPEEKILLLEISDVLHETMKNVLSDKEYTVLQRRMGLEDDRKETLAEIAEDFHVSRERIRQIESSALRKLRCNRKLRQLGREYSLYSN